MINYKIIVVFLVLITITIQDLQNDCQPGMYMEKAGQCLQCESPCYNCYNKFQCRSCQSDLNRVLNGVNCSCIAGYMEPQGGYSKKCEKCKQCPNGTFSKRSSTCIESVSQCNRICLPKCFSCDLTPSHCLVCQSDQFREQKPPNCPCKQGYYDNNGDLQSCRKCYDSCQTCQNANSCLTCKNGYYLDELSNCKQCYQYNNTCTKECPTNTTLNKDTYECIDSQSSKQIQKNHIIIFLFIFLIVLVIIICIIIIYLFYKNWKKNKEYKMDKKIKKYNDKQQLVKTITSSTTINDDEFQSNKKLVGQVVTSNTITTTIQYPIQDLSQQNIYIVQDPKEIEKNKQGFLEKQQQLKVKQLKDRYIKNMEIKRKLTTQTLQQQDETPEQIKKYQDKFNQTLDNNEIATFRDESQQQSNAQFNKNSTIIDNTNDLNDIQCDFRGRNSSRGKQQENQNQLYLSNSSQKEKKKGKKKKETKISMSKKNKKGDSLLSSQQSQKNDLDDSKIKKQNKKNKKTIENKDDCSKNDDYIRNNYNNNYDIENNNNYNNNSQKQMQQSLE